MHSATNGHGFQDSVLIDYDMIWKYTAANSPSICLYARKQKTFFAVWEKEKHYGSSLF